jgi:RNA polymerase sigma factor (sigma-70 family)
MTDEKRETLRQLLVLSYDDLRMRLTLRLGSAELAGDVLHETYLKLTEPAAVGDVRKPRLYLLRIATNIALKRLQRERRFFNLSDAKLALGIADDAPDPARIVESRVEIETLQNALQELSPRRREILLASRLDGVPLRELAARYGISQRMVEIDLRRALAHCALRLDRQAIQRFGPRPAQGSKD